MNLHERAAAKEEWRAHRMTVVAGAAGVAISSLPFYAIGAFIAPLETEFGWTRAQVVSGQIAISVIGVLGAPVIGVLVDRWGSRWIGIVGSALLCTAFALLSFATESKPQWWAQWTLLAFGSLLVTSTVWTAAVSSLFRAGRGLALALALTGGGIASTILPFTTTRLIDAFGWRSAFLVLGVAVALIALPLMALYLRDARALACRRSRAESAVGGSILPLAPAGGLAARAAFRSPAYFRLLIATLAITLAVVPFVVHLIPLLASRGIDRATAAGLAGLVGITSIIGRVAVGGMLDRLNGPLVGATCVVLPIASALLLLQLPSSIAVSAAAIMLLGLALGAELDVISYLSTRYFGLRRYGTVYGTISAALVMATGAGPVIAGALFDATQSYALFLWLVIPLCVVAAVMLGTLGPYPRFDAPAEPTGPDDRDSARIAPEEAMTSPPDATDRLTAALRVNGALHMLELDPRTTLLDALREHLHLTGTKKGCDQGHCGACTVLVNGERIVSCLTLAVSHDGDEVQTIEGVAEGERLHPLQQAFLEMDALQCGFCTPGQICSALAMLREVDGDWPSQASGSLDAPIVLDDDEIRERMSGNICRCAAYPQMLAAIRRVADERR